MQDVEENSDSGSTEGFANLLIHINRIMEDKKGVFGGAEGESEAAKGAAGESKLVQRRSVLGRSPTSQEVLRVSTHSMPAHSNAATAPPLHLI